MMTGMRPELWWVKLLGIAGVKGNEPDQYGDMYRDLSVAAVIPAYNEAPSIGQVVSELVRLQHDSIPVFDRVVVCDNASTDQTGPIAADSGAVVVREPLAGYGRACLKALEAVGDCDVVVFVDGDYSAHAEEIPLLLDECRAGRDLVIGARRADLTEPGALTPHQVLGNRLASALLRMAWRQPVTDLGPLRAVGVSALAQLQMADPTYGWTMEMQAKALAMGLSVAEVPVRTRRRIGVSKVSGTVRGTVGATWGILSTFAKLAWQHRSSVCRASPAGVASDAGRLRRA